MSFAQSQRFLPTLTGLDDRIVPSAAVSGRVLYITGTAAADSVLVMHISGFISTVIVAEKTNGVQTSKSFNPSTFDRISVSVGGGDDTVQLGTSKPATVSGGTGNDYLSGGSGADSLYGDGGNDSLYGNGGNDYLSGGAGSDYLRGGAGYNRFSTDRYDTIHLAPAPLSSGGFGLTGSGDTPVSTMPGFLNIDTGGTVTSISEQRPGFWLTDPDSRDDLVEVVQPGTINVYVDNG